jgi:hypothetical protein
MQAGGERLALPEFYDSGKSSTEAVDNFVDDL